jgi:hypothetical protein
VPAPSSIVLFPSTYCRFDTRKSAKTLDPLQTRQTLVKRNWVGCRHCHDTELHGSKRTEESRPFLPYAAVADPVVIAADGSRLLSILCRYHHNQRGLIPFICTT